MDDPKYIDLVFEDRNKAYGAYSLQRKQTLFLGIGFLVSSLLLVGGLGFRAWLNNRPGPEQAGTIKMQHKKVISYSQLTAPPPIETIDPQPKNKPRIEVPKPRATRKFLSPVVKKDEEVVTEEIIPTQRELKKVNIGKKDVEGDTTGELSGFDLTDVEVGLDGNTLLEEVQIEQAEEVQKSPAPPAPVAPEEDEVFTIVEENPSYPGGNDALLNFVYDNIVYPEIARENAIMGTVVIRFVVEKDGTVSNIEAVRDIGGGCAQEVIRVLQDMPRWTPGRQSEKPVRVSFVFPIKFELTS